MSLLPANKVYVRFIDTHSLDLTLHCYGALQLDRDSQIESRSGARQKYVGELPSDVFLHWSLANGCENPLYYGFQFGEHFDEPGKLEVLPVSTHVCRLPITRKYAFQALWYYISCQPLYWSSQSYTQKRPFWVIDGEAEVKPCSFSKPRM